MPNVPLRQRPAWKALEQHYSEIAGRHLRELFAEDPGRGERLTAEAAGLYLDYSKNRITTETLDLLISLAEEAELVHRRAAMFAGDKINVSSVVNVFDETMKSVSEGSRSIVASAKSSESTLETKRKVFARSE